jgi:hypothetical protein
VLRAFDAQIDSVEKADRSLVARINTLGLDRFNSVIDPKGGKLEAYRKNPVVLWEHGKDPRRFTDPIGRNLWIRSNGGQAPTELLAKTRFLEDDFSQQRWEWYRDGVLNAFSIHVLPQEFGPPTKDEVRARPELDNDRPNETRGQFDGPIIYRQWELAEYSGTACPGNADTLVADRAAKMLDLVARSLLWLPDDVRSVVEAKAGVTPASETPAADPPALAKPKRSAPYLDGDGPTWVVRGADGEPLAEFEEEGVARRCLAAMQAPRSWRAIHDEMIDESRARNAAVVADVQAMLDLVIHGRV